MGDSLIWNMAVAMRSFRDTTPIISGPDTENTMNNDPAITNHCVLKRLMTMRQAATTLGICPRTLYRLIASGQLPAPVRLGRASRMVCAEVDEYVERLKATRQ